MDQTRANFIWHFIKIPRYFRKPFYFILFIFYFFLKSIYLVLTKFHFFAWNSQISIGGFLGFFDGKITNRNVSCQLLSAQGNYRSGNLIHFQHGENLDGLVQDFTGVKKLLSALLNWAERRVTPLVLTGDNWVCNVVLVQVPAIWKSRNFLLKFSSWSIN